MPVFITADFFFVPNNIFVPTIINVDFFTHSAYIFCFDTGGSMSDSEEVASNEYIDENDIDDGIDIGESDDGVDVSSCTCWYCNRSNINNKV